MKSLCVLTWFMAAFISVGSCGFEDHERCRGELEYQNGFCIMPSKNQAGLGEPCERSDECTKDDTDYCAKDLGASAGICTIKNCVANPNSCPDGYGCCDLATMINDMGYPDMCLPLEALEQQSQLCSGE